MGHFGALGRLLFQQAAPCFITISPPGMGPFASAGPDSLSEFGVPGLASHSPSPCAGSLVGVKEITGIAVRDQECVWLHRNTPKGEFSLK